MPDIINSEENKSVSSTDSEAIDSGELDLAIEEEMLREMGFSDEEIADILAEGEATNDESNGVEEPVTELPPDQKVYAEGVYTEIAKMEGGPGSYPFDKCLEDRQSDGYDEESAKRICGFIRARSKGWM